MGGSRLRALMAAVVVMGVLIVGGVATLLTLIVRRVTPPAVAATPLHLDEPPGTGIAGVALTSNAVAVSLHGGGPDRVVVLDLARGRVVARIGVQ